MAGKVIYGKSALGKQLAADCGWSSERGELVVAKVFKLIEQHLCEDHTIKLGDCGTLSVMRRKATTARNPQNGELMDVPARFCLAARISRKLRGSLEERLGDGNN